MFTSLIGFVTEGRSTPASVSDALDLAERNDYDMFNPIVFRGKADGVIDDVILVRPSEHTRNSANTSNHYTVWMDNDPAWGEFPKRSSSIICSTSRNVEGYGSLSGGKNYSVWPIEPGARFGVCPDYDIWNSGPMVYYEDGELVFANGQDDTKRSVLPENISQDILPAHVLDYLKKYGKLNSSLSYQEVNSILSKSGVPDTDYASMYAKLEELGALEWYRTIMSPVGFSVAGFSELGDKKNVASDHSGVEVWTDATCMMVSLDTPGLEAKTSRPWDTDEDDDEAPFDAGI